MAGGTDAQRTILAGRVAGRGYAVETAADASAALSALVMHAPDAVVLCDAPTFDAPEVSRRLRAHAGSRQTPVAVVLAPGTPNPPHAPIDADVVLGDGPAANLLAWIDARLPPDASAVDWLRLTLAQAPDSPEPDSASDSPGDVAWQQLFEHLDDGAAVVDHDGRIRQANAALARLLDLPSAAACVGRHLPDLLPGAAAQAPGATAGPAADAHHHHPRRRGVRRCCSTCSSSRPGAARVRRRS